MSEPRVVASPCTYPARVGVNDLAEDDFERLYGRWAARTPRDVSAVLDGYPSTWWIAGGWALEAFTGISRQHDDTDPSILMADLPLLQRHLAGRFHLWSAASGALRPLLADDDLEAAPRDALLPGCGQVWLRRSAEHPWEYDVLLAPGSSEEWVYRRDETLRMPMSDALWERDGIRYLQPEIQLLYKAAGLRPKDQRDFDSTLPFLDQRRRGWLRSALQRTLSGHPWMDVLA